MTYTVEVYDNDQHIETRQVSGKKALAKLLRGLDGQHYGYTAYDANGKEVA